MNILFLYGSAIEPTKGGVQRVTSVLGTYFKTCGFNVFNLSLKKASSFFPNQFYLPDDDNFLTEKNRRYFSDFLRENKINIVINQGGHEPECSKLSYSGKEFNGKVISVIHNSPLASIKNYSSSKFGQYKRLHIGFLLPIADLKFVKKAIMILYRIKYADHYRNLVEKSDQVVLLSDAFREEFSFFLKSEKLLRKVKSIANPLAFAQPLNSISQQEKTILYVGRIDFNQKRVDILLKIWRHIFQEFPEWNLRIVGDGPDLENAKKMCELSNLKRVNFEGFKNPQEFYNKASIFCMTSAFEGFPLVLAEAQAYGVVPIAFNSFSSINEIIENDHNGILVQPFEIKTYIGELKKLIENPQKLEFLSRNAKANSSKFTVNSIGEKWQTLFKDLIHDDVK